MALTLKSVDVKAYTEIMLIESRLVMEGDVYLRVNYGSIEGFTVEDAQFSEDFNGRRTLEMYGINGEHVTLDPHECIQVVRTTLEVTK